MYLRVNDTKLEERLLKTPGLSLDNIIDLCRVTETIRINQSMLNNEDDIKSVDKIIFKDANVINCEQFRKTFKLVVDQKNEQSSFGQKFI